MTNKIAVQNNRQMTVADEVLARVHEKQENESLDIPANYSPANALQAAYLQLTELKVQGKSALEHCTKASISTALFKMVTMGLNPSKNQCYFIPYGNKLELSQSYLGTIARLKRIPGIKDVKAHAVYKNDVLEREMNLITGDMEIKSFVPSTNNRGELIGALALIIGEKEILHTEYMDMSQIKNSWNQGAMKGNSPAHKNFPDQMAMKTVINRACKMYANTSDDADIVEELKSANDDLEIEIMENANQEVLEFEEDESIPETKATEVVDNETGEIIGENDEDRVDGPPF